MKEPISVNVRRGYYHGIHYVEVGYGGGNELMCQVVHTSNDADINKYTAERMAKNIRNMLSGMGVETC